MKYNAGDIVRVREWDDMASEYNEEPALSCIDMPGYKFVDPMREFCGQIVTIWKQTDNGYRIVEDDGYWGFSELALEPVRESEMQFDTSWVNCFLEELGG